MNQNPVRCIIHFQNCGRKDFSEVVGSFLSRPATLAFGRDVEQMDSEMVLSNKQASMICRIAAGIFSILILPITLIGLGLTLFSATRRSKIALLEKSISQTALSGRITELFISSSNGKDNSFSPIEFQHIIEHYHNVEITDPRIIASVKKSVENLLRTEKLDEKDKLSILCKIYNLLPSEIKLTVLKECIATNSEIIFRNFLDRQLAFKISDLVALLDHPDISDLMRQQLDHAVNHILIDEQVKKVYHAIDNDDEEEIKEALDQIERFEYYPGKTFNYYSQSVGDDLKEADPIVYALKKNAKKCVLILIRRHNIEKKGVAGLDSPLEVVCSNPNLERFIPSFLENGINNVTEKILSLAKNKGLSRNSISKLTEAMKLNTPKFTRSPGRPSGIIITERWREYFEPIKWTPNYALTPFHMELLSDDPDIEKIEQMLKKGADPNIKMTYQGFSYYPISLLVILIKERHWQVKKYHKIIKRLTQYGAKLSYINNAPLCVAAKLELEETVVFLLDLGANPLAIDSKSKLFPIEFLFRKRKGKIIAKDEKGFQRLYRYTAPFIKERRFIKNLAMVSKYKFRIPFMEAVIECEGDKTHSTVRFLRNTWKHFLQHPDAAPMLEKLKQLHISIDEISLSLEAATRFFVGENQWLRDKFGEGKTLFIPTGWDRTLSSRAGHATSVVLNEKIVIKGNRGSKCKKTGGSGLQILKSNGTINPQRLVFENFLRDKDYFISRMNWDLSLAVQGHIPLPKQSRGNCTWASSAYLGLYGTIISLYLQNNPDAKINEIPSEIQEFMNFFELFALTNLTYRYVNAHKENPFSGIPTKEFCKHLENDLKTKIKNSETEILRSLLEKALNYLEESPLKKLLLDNYDPPSFFKELHKVKWKQMQRLHKV